MDNNFSCNEVDIGTSEKGQHCFIADESLKSWLSSSRAGISYWHCYLFPFIQKYSTADCLKIIKDPAPIIKQASTWLKKRMNRTTVAASFSEYLAAQGTQGTLGGPEGDDSDAKILSCLEHFLNKGECSVTPSLFKKCPVWKGLAEELIEEANALCERRPELIQKSTRGYLIQVPGVKKGSPKPLRLGSVYTESIPRGKIEDAQAACDTIEKGCRNAEKLKRVTATRMYLNELVELAAEGGENVQRQTTYGSLFPM